MSSFFEDRLRQYFITEMEALIYRCNMLLDYEVLEERKDEIAHVRDTVKGLKVLVENDKKKLETER